MLKELEIENNNNKNNNIQINPQKISSFQNIIINNKNSNDNERIKKNFECFGNYTRYVILLISTLCLTAMISNSLALNFSIICMNKESNITSISDDILNLTERIENKHENNDFGIDPIFSLGEQSLLFSAIAIGTLLGSLPITYFTSNFGIRKMLTSYGLLSAFSTLLLPLGVSIGLVPVFILRVLQGFGVATTFVAMGAISSAWSPIPSMGMYVSWISCHLQFGPMFTMPIAGLLCGTSWEWMGIFYVQGILSIILFSLFFYLYSDSPKNQRNISQKELMQIEDGKSKDPSNVGKNFIPYKAMLSDSAVWGILLAAFGGMLGFNIFLQYGPIYLNKVLNINVQNTGISAALPFALSCLTKMLAGPISDHITFLSERAKVIMFASVSQFAMAACFIFMAFMPTEYLLLSQICFTAAIVCSGLNCVGVVKCTQLMAQHYSHAIMAWNTFSTSVGVIILPVIVSQLAPNNTIAQWGRIFVGTAILICILTIIFNFTCVVTPRPWVITAANNKISQSSVDLIIKKDSFKRNNSIFAIDIQNLNDVKKNSL